METILNVPMISAPLGLSRDGEAVRDILVGRYDAEGAAASPITALLP